MDLSSFTDDTRKNYLIQSEIPSVTKSEPCFLGIDEAGRGPVLGPMVYGTCFCPMKFEEKLKELKCADSKKLTEEEREDIFKKIHEANDFLGWMIEIHSPSVISNNMLRRSKYNLNEMSHDSAISLIEKVLSRDVNVEEVYVDTVGDPGKYQTKLSNKFPGIKFTVAKKADDTYPIVSAASICAKVARDRALKDWKFLEDIEVEGNNWGSGYPNDPVTKKFLTEQFDPLFGFPQIVRFSWSTAEKIIQDNGHHTEWEEVEETENQPVKMKSLFSFFAHDPSKQQQNKRHRFFTDRCLKPMTNF